MSVTKQLVCIDCKKYLWFGQGGHIYTADKHIAALTEFLLVNHTSGGGDPKQHRILSVDEHEFVDGLLADCEEVEVP